MDAAGGCCMQPQVCTATPRRSLLENGFYSSCCSGCREEDGPVKIRGGYDDPSDIGDESYDPELDDSAIAGMAADYEAEQNVIDQERREEEKEEQNAPQDFPADNQAEPRVVHVPDSIAELDFEDDENFDVNIEDDELAFNASNRPEGYMQEFCYEVHKRLRIEFKKIGFETMSTNRWLKQHLQKNSDFRDTAENFNNVPLHSEELDTALRDRCEQLLQEMQRKIDREHQTAIRRPRKQTLSTTSKPVAKPRTAKFKLTVDQLELCKTMGTQLPFLPFTTPEEMQIFNQCAASLKHKDDHAMAVWWCSKVDGEKVFPKLPVHIRLYRKKWQKNRRVIDCVNRAKKSSDLLRCLNKALQPNTVETGAANSSGSNMAAPASQNAAGSANSAGSNLAAAASQNQRPPILRPSGIDQPNQQALRDGNSEVIGGTKVGGFETEPEVPRKRARGGDKPKSTGTSRQRACQRCQQFNGGHKDECGGRCSAERCDYFDESGVRRCYYCAQMKRKGKSNYDPYTCQATGGTKDDCPHFYHVQRKGVKEKNRRKRKSSSK